MIPSGIQCCLGQRMVLLRPNQAEIDGKFLLYALQSNPVRHEIFVNEGTGSTVSNLRIPLLAVLLIPKPPMPEQRAIANILGTINPEVWSKGSRPEIIDYVDLSNTKWGRIEEVALYTDKKAPSRAQRVLRVGDTIVGTVRPGNGSYAFIADHGLTGSTGFAVLRPKTQSYAGFVYLATTSEENIIALSHLADGGAYPAVRPEVVATTPVTIADYKVLVSFSKIAGPLLYQDGAKRSRVAHPC